MIEQTIIDTTYYYADNIITMNPQDIPPGDALKLIEDCLVGGAGNMNLDPEVVGGLERYADMKLAEVEDHLRTARAFYADAVHHRLDEAVADAFIAEMRESLVLLPKELRTGANWNPEFLSV